MLSRFFHGVLITSIHHYLHINIYSFSTSILYFFFFFSSFFIGNDPRAGLYTAFLVGTLCEYGLTQELHHNSILEHLAIVLQSCR